MTQPFYSPDDVIKKGEAIYFSRLKDELEPTHSGETVVIEVDSGEYFINKDVLVAVNEARAKFPDKLFYIATIGSISKTSTNFQYAWNLPK